MWHNALFNIFSITCIYNTNVKRNIYTHTHTYKEEISIRHGRNSCCSPCNMQSMRDISLYYNAMHQAVRFIPLLYHLRHFHPFREARDARDGTRRIAKYPNYQPAPTSVSFGRKRFFFFCSIANALRNGIPSSLTLLIFRRTSNNVRLSRPHGQSRHVRAACEVKYCLTTLRRDHLCELSWSRMH